MIKILGIGKKPHDTTNFYRGLGAFSYLRKNGVHYVDYSEQSINWAILIQYDIVYMMRPDGIKHVRVIEMAKTLGVKVWVDYDDNLVELPAGNPAYLKIHNEQFKKIILSCIYNADLVSFSTRELYNYFKEFNKNKALLRNAYNDYAFQQKTKTKKTKRILWRGSESHRPDLEEFKYEILSLVKKYTEHEFYFYGILPEWLIGIKNVKAYPTHDMLVYLNNIQDIQPDVVLVPLQDNIFNKCKSSIASQEAVLCADSAIVPNWEDWDSIPGNYHYNNKKEFVYLACKAIEKKDVADANTRKASTLLSTINEIRLNIIMELVDKCQNG